MYSYHGYPVSWLYSPGAKIVIALLLIWTIHFWKGVALWKSARNTQKAWFVVLLIVNTLGILEIIYILGFSRPKHGVGEASSEHPRGCLKSSRVFFC